MKTKRVLIADDESTLRTALFRLFTRNEFQVVTAQNSIEIKAFLSQEHKFDLCIINFKLMENFNDIDLNLFNSNNSDIKIIGLSDNKDQAQTLTKISLNIHQSITKPFTLETLLQNSIKLLSSGQIKTEKSIPLIQKSKFQQIIGESESIKNCLSLVDRVADSDSTVLIMGESGTGKELIARAIHNNSSRSQGPFVAINCGAIPSELLESELFGHIKGAFTGAVNNRAGRFELADEGTLFLDEIGDLAPSLQVKLLRVLQEKSFEPVGSTKTITANVRVITATNVDLEKAVTQGQFREDLYYRLNVIPINIPALRDRKSDIPLLLNYFLKEFNKNRTKSISGFSTDSLNYLINYAWPGNIRELENLVERLSILKGEGEVFPQDLPPKYKIAHNSLHTESSILNLPENGVDFNSAVDQFENALILKALERTGWNKNQAALLLRLNRTTLVEKMKKKGLKNELENLDNEI